MLPAWDAADEASEALEPASLAAELAADESWWAVLAALEAPEAADEASLTAALLTAS